MSNPSGAIPGNGLHSRQQISGPLRNSSKNLPHPSMDRWGNEAACEVCVAAPGCTWQKGAHAPRLCRPCTPLHEGEAPYQRDLGTGRPSESWPGFPTRSRLPTSRRQRKPRNLMTLWAVTPNAAWRLAASMAFKGCLYWRDWEASKCFSTCSNCKEIEWLELNASEGS